MLGKRFFDLFHGRSASVVPRSCRSFGSSCREKVLCLRMSDKNWLNLDAKRIFLYRVIDYSCLSSAKEISTFSYISHQSEPLWPESINNLTPQHTVNHTCCTPPGQKQEVAIKKRVTLSYFAELPLALIVAHSCCGSASISFGNVQELCPFSVILLFHQDFVLMESHTTDHLLSTSQRFSTASRSQAPRATLSQF